MEIRIFCDEHQVELEVQTSNVKGYDVFISVSPCPECAAQQARALDAAPTNESEK